MLHCSNEAHAHLLHPVRARDLINQLAKKLVSSLAISPARREGKTPETESTTSVMMTVTISSRESSCLANCRPPHVSVHCCLFFFFVFFFVQSIQEASVRACS